MAHLKPKFEVAQLTFRLPAELKRALEELANADRRTMGDYCRNVLEDHCEYILTKRRQHSTTDANKQEEILTQQ